MWSGPAVEVVGVPPYVDVRLDLAAVRRGVDVHLVAARRIALAR